jgi:histidinol phosphatase-like enzyme (inositol monophosphatase family)
MKTPAPFRGLYAGRAEAAVELARMAGQSTLQYFGKQVDVQRKGDNSPVTIADKQAEQLIRAELSKRFPEDAILGEEFGEHSGTSEYQWVIDPIDGTKSFITGVPLYSTLVALLSNRQVLAGVIYIPALDEMISAAKDNGAWHSVGNEDPIRASVSKRTLADGAFLVSQSDLFARRGASQVFDGLQSAAYVTRTWGDGYGYLLVATGRAELMVDPVANPWDLAAVQIVIDEAGGCFTDWKGNRTAFGGDGIGSNGVTHNDALELTSIVK